MGAVRKAVTVDRYVSVPQAAREIRKAHATVLSLALKGELTSELIAGRTVITRESLDQYKARVASEEAAARES